MSNRKPTKASITQKISEAASKVLYAVVSKDKNDNFNMSTHISLNGALSNQWKDGKEMWYWPEFRLASAEYSFLYEFAIEYGLMEQGVESFGPLIGSGSKEIDVGGERMMVLDAIVYDVLITVKGKNSELEIIESEDQSIPTYTISYESSNGSSSLKSKMNKKAGKYSVGSKSHTREAAYGVEAFFDYEKAHKAHVDLDNKSSSSDKMSLKDLDDIFIKLGNGQTISSSSKKTTKKASKELTVADLVERVKAKRESSGNATYVMDITNATDRLTGGRIVKPTGNLIYAFAEDDEYSSYFAINSKSKNTGYYNFFDHVFETQKASEDHANAMLDANEGFMIEPKVRVRASPKRTTKRGR